MDYVMAENADLKGRTPAAVRSMKIHVSYRRDVIARMRKLTKAELLKTTDIHKRAELQAALADVDAEEKQLTKDVKNSTLLKYIREHPKRQDSIHNTGGIESRILTSTVPIKSASNSRLLERRSKSGLKLVGYAAKFDCDSQDLGGFIETIAPGAFKNAIVKSDVRFLINHDTNYLLGRTAKTANGTLRLYEDKIGLKFWNDINEADTIAMSMLARIERGDMSGCSFSFTTKKDEWTFGDNGGIDRRRILEIDVLYDIGAVTYPAYLDTEVEVLDERKTREQLDHEDFLRTEADEFRDFDIQQERIERGRKKETERLYRFAGRIINRNQPTVLAAMRKKLYGWD